MNAPTSSSALPRATPGAPTAGARILAVTSGKGGVGKTMVAANLAAALTRQGRRVLVIDADLGLANLDVVLNLRPTTTLHDVFTGRATLDQALQDAPGGFQVLLAGSGLVEYSRLTPELREQFDALLASVRPHYDDVLLDTGAGISDVVLYAVSLADEVLVVATPEPTSLTDAYATIKVLAVQQNRVAPLLAVNQVHRSGEGRGVAQQLQTVIDRFVRLADGRSVQLHYQGEIPSDPSVRDAIQKRQLVLLAYPGAQAALSIGQLAKRLTQRLGTQQGG